MSEDSNFFELDLPNSNSDLSFDNRASLKTTIPLTKTTQNISQNREQQSLIRKKDADLAPNKNKNNLTQNNQSSSEFNLNRPYTNFSSFFSYGYNLNHQPFQSHNDDLSEFEIKNEYSSKNEFRNQETFEFKNKNFSFKPSDNFTHQLDETLFTPVSLHNKIEFLPSVVNAESNSSELNFIQDEIKQFYNPGDSFIKLKAKKRLDHNFIKNRLQSSGPIISFHILSYTTFFIQFATHTMAVHAMNRINDSTFMNKKENPNQIKYTASLKSNEEINDLLRKRQQDIDTTFSPPKCLCVHGLDPKIDNISHLMRPFNLQGSYEIVQTRSEVTVYTYHVNVSSVKDFLSAFQDNFSGVPNTYVTEEPNRRIIQNVCEIIKKKLVFQCMADVKKMLQEDVIVPSINSALREPDKNDGYDDQNQHNNSVQPEISFAEEKPPSEPAKQTSKTRVALKRSNSNPHDIRMSKYSALAPNGHFGGAQSCKAVRFNSEPNLAHSALFNQYSVALPNQNQTPQQYQQVQTYGVQPFHYQGQQQQQLFESQQYHYQQAQQFECPSYGEGEGQVQYDQMFQQQQFQVQPYQQSQLVNYGSVYYTQPVPANAYLISPYQSQVQVPVQQKQPKQQKQQKTQAAKNGSGNQKQPKAQKQAKEKKPRSQVSGAAGRKKRKSEEDPIASKSQPKKKRARRSKKQKQDDDDLLQIIEDIQAHGNEEGQHQRNYGHHSSRRQEEEEEEEKRNEAQLEDKKEADVDQSNEGNQIQLHSSIHPQVSFTLSPSSFNENGRYLNFYIGSRSNLTFFLSSPRSKFSSLVRSEAKHRRKQLLSSGSCSAARQYEREMARQMEQDTTFESIKQPMIENNSSRLTPIHKIEEWHKRVYLRPYASMRRKKYILARKSGLPILKTQFSDTNMHTSSAPKANSRNHSISDNNGSLNVGDEDLNALKSGGVVGKKVYFEKSEIQGYGLFALEPISPKDFICEYTGQLIRMEVADRREKKLSKKGFQHMYLFRLGQMVIDATEHGSNARFLNHSCAPNCRARQITIKDMQTISFFATKTIKPHDEIAFNYEMELENDPSKWEKCYCGAKECNGYLNYSFRRSTLNRMWKEANNLVEENSDDSS